MPIQYPGISPTLMTPGMVSPSGTSFVNHKAKDIAQQFASIPDSGDSIGFRFASGIFPGHRYTGWPSNGNTFKNHFQGIQRLRDGKYFLISAGDSTDKHAHLLLGKLQTQANKPITDVKEYCGSNLLFDKSLAPTSIDILQEMFVLNNGRPKFWHAGGISIVGDILVLALENQEDKTSEIVFYNVKNPSQILQYNFVIDRPNNKAGGATMIRLPNNFFVCVVFTNSDVPDPVFDFYISQSTDFDDGFLSAPVASVKYKHISNPSNRIPNFQNIEFIQQKFTNKTYLICTENISSTAPTIEKNNRIELIEVNIPVSLDNTMATNVNTITLHRASEKEIDGGRPMYNFNAGAGCYISPNNQLILYGVYHWRAQHLLKLGELQNNEWRTRKIQIHNKSEAWVEFYDKPNFKGRCLRLYGNDIKNIPDFNNVYALDKDFHDKTKSIIHHLPIGISYELFENKNFNGGNTSKNKLTLIGNGFVQSIPDLDDHTMVPNLHDNSKAFGNKISSSR